MGNKINVKQFGIYHPYVFYHNDMDGKAAAWQLHEHFDKLSIPDTPSDYQHYNYEPDGMKLGSLNKNTVCYIVDLSFTESTYHTLLDICGRCAHVIWIDHHDSSIKLLADHPNLLEVPNLHVFVSKDACGAVLIKIYLELYLEYVCPLEQNYQKFKDVNNKRFDINWYDPKEFKVEVVHEFTEDRMPFLNIKFGIFSTCIYIDSWLEMVDDYDRYCLRNDDTRAFIEGTNIENTSIVYKSIGNKIEFNEHFWGYLDTTAYDYVNNGCLIIKYKDKKNADELDQCFEWKDPWTCTTIICKNDRGTSYNFLDHYNRYSAVLLFRYNGKVGRWFYSVYSRVDSTFDCAAFCSHYGGGGHLHAAGFNTDKLIFDVDI